MTDNQPQHKEQENFPYILLRDILLPNILGEETEEILYWAGKELARQFPLSKEEDLADAFRYCGFGTLTRMESFENQQTYHLSGNLIEERMENESISFALEAGFLAEQCARILKRPTEVLTETSEKKEVICQVYFY